MKKEDFTALGISEELAEKAAEEFKDYVPRARLNEEIQKKKNAEQSYETVKAELDKLKETAGSNEEMQTKITSLQEELKKKETEYTSEISKMKMDNAIRAGIGGIAHDADLVAGQLDQSKLILQDDGKVSGLDDQLKSLKESKPFLFKDEEGSNHVPDGGEPSHSGGKSSTAELFAMALNS